MNQGAARSATRLAGFADRPNLLVAISHHDYLSSASVSLQISSGAIFR
jgi:hypothetical protein